MADPDNQAAFVASLRKKAEELAAKNPVFADLRSIGKALVDEARKRIADGNEHPSIGAYLSEGTISLIDPEATETEQAGTEMLSKLRELARKGTIQAAGVCKVIEKQMPGGSIEKFVSVHAEHSTGKAVTSQIPADEAVLMRGVPGASGPAVGVSGGPANPKIFVAGNPNAPVPGSLADKLR
jgi:hypothetical protein